MLQRIDVTFGDVNYVVDVVTGIVNRLGHSPDEPLGVGLFTHIDIWRQAANRMYNEASRDIAEMQDVARSREAMLYRTIGDRTHDIARMQSHIDQLEEQVRQLENELTE